MGATRREYAIANDILNAAIRRAGRACPPPWCKLTMRRRLLRAYEQAQALNRKTGIPHHVDHIIPLHGDGVCGLHVPWNLHPIPGVINMAKRVMIVDEYADADVDTKAQRERDRIALKWKQNAKEQQMRSRANWRRKQERKATS